MRFQVLTFALLLLPVPALAQTSTMQIQVQGGDAVAAGPGQCNSQIPVSYTLGLASFCSDLDFWFTTAATCPDQPAADEEVIHSVPQLEITSNTGTFNVAVSDLPLFSDEGSTAACGDPGEEEEYKLCGAVEMGTGFIDPCSTTRVIKPSSPPTVTYDSLAPPAPVVTQVVALDSALSVHLDVDEDVDEVTVFARLPGTTAQVSEDTGVVPTGALRLGGLQNGVTYEVVAIAEDHAGNVSGESAPASGTPERTLGFGQRFNDLGGEGAVGCAAAGGGMIPSALGLLGVLIFTLRRRPWR